jgi:hypothetical protein
MQKMRGMQCYIFNKSKIKFYTIILKYNQERREYDFDKESEYEKF